MQIVRGCASSRISNWRASCGHGLNQVGKHLLWDGHPLLKCLEQLLMQMCRFVHSPSNTSVQLVQVRSLSLRHVCPTRSGSFTLPQTRLSNSFQTCWVGQDKKPGTSLDIVAVTGKKLRSVAGCIRSGVVVLKHSTRGSQKDDDEWMHGFSTVSCTFRASWTCSTRGASIHCSCMHMCVSCPRHCRRSG